MKSLGLCASHYMRQWRHGDPLAPIAFIKGDDEARFWAKIDKGGPAPADRPDLGPCWLWTASVFANGYGQFKIGGRARGAHIVAYEWENGPVPEGLELDHLCRVRPCVRPLHLEPVTHDENMKRVPAEVWANCRKKAA